MKCPFKQTKTFTTARDQYEGTTQLPAVRIESISFEDCDEENCMAYIDQICYLIRKKGQ